MKKFFVMFAATAAMVFAASCSKDNGGETADVTTKTLTVKLTGMATDSRAVGAPGVNNTAVELGNGHIYIISTTGEVLKNAVLDKTKATGAGTGQEFTGVPSNAGVYVVCNVAAEDLTGLGTLKAIQDKVYEISAAATNYKNAPMANTTGAPTAIVAAAESTTAAVAVEIAPLYSRIELKQVNGGAHITSFDVAGVYVDDYYTSYSLTGAGAGNLIAIESNIANAGDNKDVYAAGTERTSTVATEGVAAVATAGSTNVWNYHVPAGTAPRFIVKVQNIAYLAENGAGSGDYSVPAKLETPRYITVKGYTGVEEGFVFERGKIYQIESVSFDEDKVSQVPNDPNTVVTVSVTVQAIPWTTKELQPEI